MRLLAVLRHSKSKLWQNRGARGGIASDRIRGAFAAAVSRAIDKELNMKKFLLDDKLERASTSASALTQAEQRWLSDAQRDSSSPYFATSENVRTGRNPYT